MKKLPQLPPWIGSCIGLFLCGSISFMILTFIIGLNYLTAFVINQIDNYYHIKDTAAFFLIVELYVVWLVIFAVTIVLVIIKLLRITTKKELPAGPVVPPKVVITPPDF